MEENFYCNQCGYTVSRKDVQTLQENALKLYSSAIIEFEQKGNLNNALNLISQAYVIQTKILSPYNRSLQDTRFKYSNMLSLIQAENTTPLIIQYLKESIEFLYKIGHPYQIPIAVSWFRIGNELEKGLSKNPNNKKKKMQEEIKKAYKESWKIYSFIFGEDHFWVQYLNQKISQS